MNDERQLNEVIKVQRRTNSFVMMDKTFLEDDRLSFKAKGILAYLLSRPDNWKVIVGHLVHVSKEGKASVYAGLKELKEYGYYEKIPIRNEQGTKIIRWESTIYEIPIKAREEEVTKDTITPEEPKSEQKSVCSMEDDSFEMKMTEKLIACCKNSLSKPVNLPDTTEKKQVWAVYIHQLIKAGYSEGEIEKVMDYATENAFWKTHIKSTKKFKEKFETLLGQVVKKEKKVPQTRINTLLTDFQEIENQEIENRERNNNDCYKNINNYSLSVMSSPSLKTDKTDRGQDIENEIITVRNLIHENIEYESFQISHPLYLELIDEIVEIMLDVLLTKQGTMYIDGMEKPIALVKSKLMKVQHSHVEFVMEQYKNRTTRIQKKSKYILSMLYHSVMELNAHYSNLVNYDMWTKSALVADKSTPE